MNYSNFYISYVVFKEEVIKQVNNDIIYSFNFINEKLNELLIAQEYSLLNKRISFYDALNLVLAQERKMILVTGDQELIKFAHQKNVECIGTIKLIELLAQGHILEVDECIKSLKKLKNHPKRRLPHKLLDSSIEKLQSLYLKIK